MVKIQCNKHNSTSVKQITISVFSEKTTSEQQIQQERTVSSLN